MLLCHYPTVMAKIYASIIHQGLTKSEVKPGRSSYVYICTSFYVNIDSVYCRAHTPIVLLRTAKKAAGD